MSNPPRKKPERSFRRKPARKAPKSDYRKLRNIAKFQRFLQSSPNDCELVIFDIETTGGNPEKNGLTEFCGIKVKNGKIIDEFQTLINPEVPIPPIVRKMTGINDRMVKNAPKIDVVMPKILEFIGQRIVVSHNTIGDLKFIRYFSEKVCQKRFENFFVCTHLLSEKVLSDSPDKSLKGLANYLDLHFEGAHRAEADAHITFDLYKAIISRLSALGINKIEQVIRMQGDYESSFRLGWGVPEEQCEELSETPGVIIGKSLANKPMYCLSTLNVQREVPNLTKYGELPKQLLRKVFQTYELHFEESRDIIEAAKREALLNRQYKLAAMNHYAHHRRINSFNFEDNGNGKIVVSSGFANKSTFLALGPVHDRKTASRILEKIGHHAGEMVGRSKLMIDKSELFFVYVVLTKQFNEYISFLESRVQGLMSVLFPRRQSEYVQLINKLKEVQSQPFGPTLSDLLEIRGELQIEGHASHSSYIVKKSRIAKRKKIANVKRPDQRDPQKPQFVKSPKQLLKYVGSRRFRNIDNVILWETICWLVFSNKGRKYGEFLPKKK